MIGEVSLGLFNLALGWLCLSHAFRHRRIGHARPMTRTAEHVGEEDKPRTLIPIVLGVVFLLVGKALLVSALVEMF